MGGFYHCVMIIVQCSALPFFLQVFILQVQLAIIQQWLIPTALHSLQPFKEMDWAKMVERVFLLAVSLHYLSLFSHALIDGIL